MQQKNEKKQTSIQQKMINLNKRVSFGIDAIAERIDTFLSGEKVTSKRNRSSIIIQQSMSSNEGQSNISNVTRFDINLRLPNLEESWQLRFTSYDEEEDEGINRTRINNLRDEEDYGASLVWLKKLGDIDVSFKPRIKLKDPIETSYRLQFESRAKKKGFEINPRFELFAKSATGTGEFFALNFLFPITEKWQMELINEEQYVDGINIFSTNHEIALMQTLKENMGLRYAILFESNNDVFSEETTLDHTFRLQKYTGFIAFNHRLYKNVLHYNVIPLVTFDRRQKFSHHYGIRMNISLIF